MHYPEIIREIVKQGFEKPSPIQVIIFRTYICSRCKPFSNSSSLQSQMWPLVLRGYDVIGIAQTGTGKTLAFLLPAFIHIDLQPT